MAEFNDENNRAINEQQLFPNPAYEAMRMTTTRARETEPTLGHTGSLINENYPATTYYASVNLSSQQATDNGQTCDALNRGQENSK